MYGPNCISIGQYWSRTGEKQTIAQVDRSGLWPVSVWTPAKNGFYIFKGIKKKKKQPTKNIRQRPHVACKA